MKGQLHHKTPGWVPSGSRFHIRIRLASGTKSLLTDATVGRVVLDAAGLYHDAGKWCLYLMLLTPDHLHAVASFPQEPGMSQTIGAWKGFLRKTTGVRWQANYFDHRLRNDDESIEKMHCIRMNPVRAGLVAEGTAWPWVLEPDPGACGVARGQRQATG